MSFINTLIVHGNQGDVKEGAQAGLRTTAGDG
jgi:hypothetical protein